MSTLEMDRFLPAPPARVFAAITQTAFLLDWWGPPGTRIGDHNLDFSKPGPWSATMISANDHAATIEGEVRRVEPPTLVELTLRFREGEQIGPESVIQFAIAPEGQGARLTLTQTGLDPAHIEDMRNKGWNGAFARLKTLLETH